MGSPIQPGDEPSAGPGDEPKAEQSPAESPPTADAEFSPTADTGPPAADTGPEPSRLEMTSRRRRRRKIIGWTAGVMTVVLVIAVIGGYAVWRHLNGNIQQRDISGLLGSQPVDLHPQAENILVIGSDSRFGLGARYGRNLTTDQSDTLMIVHIAADRKWAEVMSIPRDSYVPVPSCEMGDGQLSAPATFKINSAFATGNLDGNKTELGVACSVKTVEQNTGIHIDHFVVVNFTGFKNMVAALGGVEACINQPINDPLSGLHLTAGRHLLTPTQALGYVRARYTLGDGSDLERIVRQQAFMSSLVNRVKSKLYDPLAIYRFLDAATKSLMIDSQMGGLTGLYDIAESLRSLPSDKVAFFTVPNYIDPVSTANVLWTQPAASEIFQSFRDDVPASKALFSAPTVTDHSASKESGRQATASASPTPSATASATSSPALGARTANQNICTG
jgi:LCP family protein required for cell wall assembly